MMANKRRMVTRGEQMAKLIRIALKYRWYNQHTASQRGVFGAIFSTKLSLPSSRPFTASKAYGTFRGVLPKIADKVDKIIPESAHRGQSKC